MTIDAFGGSVLEAFDARRLEGMPNLRYHGPYAGFASLPTSQFSIFLYTSLQDGVPNALLEAMSHGLAVIAPNVGGVSEVVIDGETGILLPSLADENSMAASYIQSLLRLANDDTLIERLGSQARSFVLEHHSPEAHAKRVADILGLQQRQGQHHAAEV
jgi:glycosyltransferase involved in cell wall biosynthesis